MDLVPFELLADAVGPREQVARVGTVFDLDQPRRFVQSDVAAVEHAAAHGVQERLKIRFGFHVGARSVAQASGRRKQP